MMLEEENGYNPFVDGGADHKTHDEDEGKELKPANHSFLEGDYGKRFSFLESSPLPARRNSTAPSSAPSSPALRVVLPPNNNDLDNPFVNDPISLDDNTSQEPSLPSLPPTSPTRSPSGAERLTYSPALSVRSPRLPTSPLASSSSLLVPPRSDSPGLFTYKSPPTPRSVVTLEKAEWVPDTHSLVCEHCSEDFTFIQRRHHCRVCGHLFCADCMVKITLPATLGFTTSQKSCVRCAYRAIKMRGNFTATCKDNDGLSIGQRLSARMQNFVYRMAGMYEGGKFDRFATTIAAPRNFTTFQTESVFTLNTKYELRKVALLKIPTDDGKHVKAHAYIPKGEGPWSILVYIPGGAFVLETEPSLSQFCRELCCKIGCIVISINYRLSPEWKYPIAWEDCYTAVKWIYESSALDLAKLEKDPKIVLCGEGTGGLLATAVCQMARDRGSPPISYQLLVTPWLNISTIDLRHYGEGYGLPKEVLEWVIKQVFMDPNDRDKPYSSPLLMADLANLPPTKILTAGHDPLRNDAEEYANLLRKHDVQVSVTRYENSMHGFVGNYAEAVSELEEAMYECVVCVREVFGRGEPVGAAKETRSTPSAVENRVADNLAL